MSYSTVKTRNLAPRFRGLTRKHNVAVIEYDGDNAEVECFGCWWDGGSKSEYHTIDLTTGRINPIGGQGSPPEYGGMIPRVKLTPGLGVLEGGVFCGKIATIKFHVLRGDVVKLFEN